MRLVSKSGETKERRMASYLLTDADNRSKTFLRFHSPRDIERHGTADVGRGAGRRRSVGVPAGDPKGRSGFRRAARRTRFMGTDFAFEDLRPESLSLHTYTLVGLGDDRREGRVRRRGGRRLPAVRPPTAATASASSGFARTSTSRSSASSTTSGSGSRKSRRAATLVNVKDSLLASERDRDARRAGRKPRRRGARRAVRWTRDSRTRSSPRQS